MKAGARAVLAAALMAASPASLLHVMDMVSRKGRGQASKHYNQPVRNTAEIRAWNRAVEAKKKAKRG